MKIGDTFTLDAQGLQETAEFTKVTVADLQSKVSVGDTFSLSKKNKFNTTIVQGTRWVDGKPQKGRPRRFARATVARLLGEDDSDFVAAQETDVVANAVADVAAAVALENRATELLGDTDDEPVVAEVADDVSW